MLTQLPLDTLRVIPLARLPAIQRLPDGAFNRIVYNVALGDAGSSVTTTDVGAGAGANAGTNTGPLADSLGPPLSGNPFWDNDVSHLRAEIKIDGKVIGRVYNSGAVELADAYGHLGEVAGFGSASEGSLMGPELADLRINKLADLLKVDISKAGEEVADDPATKFDASIVMASTAITQAQWLAEKAKMPGSILSKEA
jgi:hypothetical protein